MRYEPLDSRVDSVTLFEDRAEVRRLSTVTLPAGVHGLQIGGLSLSTDDGSLLIAAIPAPPGGSAPPSQEIRVLSARIRRQIHADGADAATREAALQRVEAARAALIACRDQRARLQDQLQRQEGLGENWIGGFAFTPAAADQPGWESGWQALQSALEPLIRAIRDAALAIDAAIREAELAEGRYAAACVVRQRFSAAAEIQIQLDAPATLRLELRYLTPCALWRPAHEARLLTAPDAPDHHIVAWQVMAVAWNATGEAWEGVALTFSTARPGRAADPPLLQEDRLLLRPKTEDERRNIRVEAREVDIRQAGEEGRRDVSSLPGVEDGGEPLSFNAPARGALPSNGMPVWFPLIAQILPATLTATCWPERAEVVYLRAALTNTSPPGSPGSPPTPLLAGPIRLSRHQSWVGVGRLDFVPRGEAFSVGFGTDDSLSVRRRTEDRRETTPLTGTQKLQRTVKLHIGNLSGERRTLRLIERVPGSEISEVSVALIEDGGGDLDKDNLLTFTVTLEPNERKTLQYLWKLEADSKVILS